MGMDIDNAREVIAQLKLTAQRIGAHQHRMLYRAGALVRDTAVRYAPKSPTMAEKEARSTGTKAQREAGKRRRQDRATSRPMPGGLMRSIEMRATESNAEIFCAANSEAGKYAWRIHEEKGKTWFRRGVGTVAKGAKADDKFIERALKDNAENIRRIAEDQVSKAIAEAGTR